MTTVEAPPRPGSLKKLGFVPEASARSYEIATNIYSTAKSYVPASLQPRIEKVEESVTNASAPYVTKAQDKGAELLKAADERVDKAIGQASQVYANNSAFVAATVDRQKAYHAQNLESYKAAREHYLKVVEQGVDYLKRVGVSGAAKAAVDEVSARVADARALPGMVLTRVQESVDRLLRLAPVHRAVEGLKPGVDAAYSRYASLHDGVVSSPQYKRALAAGQNVIARAQATQLYARSRSALYPYVAPYAEPAAQRLQPYYLRVVEHLAPKEA